MSDQGGDSTPLLTIDGARATIRLNRPRHLNRLVADDLAALARHGLGLTDIVVVNLYPFVKAASNPETPFEHLVEEIDIGGPSLVRAAAKNHEAVAVLTNPSQYEAVLDELRTSGSLSNATRHALARAAFAHTAAYDAAIVQPLKVTSETALWKVVDAGGIDGAVNGVAGTAGFVGGILRYVQSGNVQRYAAFLFTGLVILAIVFTRV